MAYSNPIGVVRLDDAYRAQKASERDIDTDYFGSVIKAGWMADEVVEASELATQPYDPNFKLSDDVKTQLATQYSQEEQDYLMKSDSLDEYNQRMTNVEGHRRDAERLSSYGTAGAVGSLVAGFLDPVGIAVGAATGGAGKVMQMGRLGRMALGATTGAVEGLATGYFEKQYNTQMTDTDILMQGVFGAGLGTAFGALSKAGRHAEAEADAEVGRVATDVAADLDPEVRANRESMIVDEFDREIAPYGVSRETAETDLKVYRRKLAREYDSQGANPKAVEQRIAQGKKAIEDIKLKIRANRVRTLDTRRANKAKAEELAVKEKAIRRKYEPEIWRLEYELKTHDLSSRVTGQKYKQIEAIRTKMDAQIKAANTRTRKKVEEVVDPELEAALKRYEMEVELDTERLAEARKNKGARDRLRKWDRMTRPEQLLQMYTETPPKPKTGSLSAAKTEGREFEYVDQTEKERDVGYEFEDAGLEVDPKGNFQITRNNKLADMMQATYTTLASSTSAAVRGFAIRVLENPQGATRDGQVSRSSASIEAAVIGREMRTHGGGAFVRNQAYHDYARANKVNIVRAHFDRKLKAQWNRDVTFALVDSADYAAAPKYIQKAVDSLRAQYEFTLTKNKEAGVEGFKDINYDAHYVPKILDSNALIAAISKHGRDSVTQVISKAYQTGGYKVKKKAADKLAEVRVEQVLRGRTSADQPELPTTMENLNYLRDELTKAGVDPDTIEGIISGKVDKEVKEMMSDRAKASLKPNVKADFNGLTYYDLIRNDVEEVMESYIREQAANVAFKRTVGVGSYRAVKAMVTAINQRSLESGTPKDRIDQESAIMSQSIDAIYGRSLNPEEQANLAAGMQRLRAFTSIIRLQAMGITNLGELPRVIASQGVRAALNSAPMMRREHIKAQNRADLMEADELLSFSGEDWAFEPITMDGEAFDEISAADGGKYQNAMRTLDSALASGKRISGMANLFRVTQGVGERMSTRGVVYNLKHGKVSAQQGRDAGWIGKGKRWEEVNGTLREVDYEYNRLDDIKAFMKEHPKTQNGRKLLNLEKMAEVDPELLHDLKIGVMRLSSRDMQRMHNGELPLFFNKWLGQTMMQFRSFPYAALSKQLIHDLRGDRSVAATTFMASALMAHLTIGAKIGLAAAGDPDKDFDDLWDERMTGMAYGLNLMNAMSQLSFVSMGLDGLATLNLTPEAITANQDNAYQGARPLTPAVLGLGQDVYKAIGGVKDGNAEQTFQSLHKLTPLAGTIGISQGIQQLYKE